MLVGAQFYTIREYCQNQNDFAESLKRVADIGYKTVQISGVCAYSPEWLKAELEKNGLRCVITHTAPDILQHHTLQAVRDHDVFGCKYVGLGSFPFSDETSYQEFLSVYRPVAKTLQEGGKYFMYHNHDTEFIKLGDQIILEKLMQDVPAKEMGFTLDTFWVQAGGGDPAQWIQKLSGRVPCIHLKDYAYGRKMAVIGEGNINFDRVFESAEQAGTEYMLVEQDDCNGEDPFDCLKRSYQYLKAMGFE